MNLLPGGALQGARQQHEKECLAFGRLGEALPLCFVDCCQALEAKPITKEEAVAAGAALPSV